MHLYDNTTKNNKHKKLYLTVCTLCSPTTTWKMLGSSTSPRWIKQWAAVRTWRQEISVPPQKILSVSFTRNPTYFCWDNFVNYELTYSISVVLHLVFLILLLTTNKVNLPAMELNVVLLLYLQQFCLPKMQENILG